MKSLIYSHNAVMHFVSDETGKWKQSTIGINCHNDGTFTSGERKGPISTFDKDGKHESGAYINLKTVQESS